MKGVIFTTFLEMVEDKFGYETVDTIIDNSDLPSGGVYTAVGTYSHHEIVNLVVELSKKTNIPIPTLLRVYGKHLFGILSTNYKMFVESSTNVFDFLANIENYIHVEVKKLYPDAELPRFETELVSDKQMMMMYYSDRKMADLAYGLMEGSIEYYKEAATIEMLPQNEEQSIVKFLITKA
jgi:Haem-NO-binding